MKTVLKPPGCILSKPGYDGPVSSFAFNFNLRRYIEANKLAEARNTQLRAEISAAADAAVAGNSAAHREAKDRADNEVGRCRLTVSNLMLKAHMVSALKSRMS
jgi:hypothetical protein